MAAVVNSIDKILQAAPTRTTNLAGARVLLTPTTNAFHVTAAGANDPASITFTAALIDLEGAISFSATGGTLTSITANTAVLTYANMSGATATVTASVTSNGQPYSGSCFITKVQDGAQGPAGTSTYTWIKYADSAAGAGLSDDPTGKAYIGFAYNKSTAIESTVATDYTWSLIKGSDGNQGIPGPAGSDGTPRFIWVKYSDNANGAGMYDAPTASTLYIGIAPNQTVQAESGNPADYVWSRFKGDQGVPGPAGAVTYTWIRYADSAAGAGISNDPAGKTYIGLAYNKLTATESTVATDYAWSLIQGPPGPQGNQGVEGPVGPTGAATYTWVKYSDNADGTGLYDTPTAATLYIGIAVNKTVQAESTVKTDYVWSKFRGDQGVQGPIGPSGQPTYTWIKYADSAAGAGLSDDPAGKLYIGFAYNKSTATESTTASDYSWSLIKGDQGPQGVQGPIGPNGAPTYTWIKYADVADGTGLYDTPTASTLYIGIAPNKTTATESTVKTDYVWSKFKGDQGVQGPQGNTGSTGPRGAGQYYATGSAWSDATADAATPGANIADDLVTISNGSTYALTKRWDGAAWVNIGQVIDGNLLVTGSVSAAKVNTNGLIVRATDGTPIVGIGVPLNPAYAAPDTKNSELVPSINSAATTAQWANIAGQANAPASNATVGADASNLKVGTGGKNLLNNSLPVSAIGYSVVANSPIAGGVVGPMYASSAATDAELGYWSPANTGSVYMRAPGTPAAGTSIDLRQNLDNRTPVAAGRRYEIGVGLSLHRCSAVCGVAWFDAAGALVTERSYDYSATLGPNFASKANIDFPRAQFFVVAPAGAVTAAQFVRQFHDGTQSNCYTFTSQWYMGEALPAQTMHSPWAEGAAPLASGVAAAQAAADEANAVIANITANGVLDRGEKPEIIQKWNVINAEHMGVYNQATALGLTAERDSFYATVSALSAYLTIADYANTTTDTTIDRTIFNSKFADYYTTKETLRIAIAAKIQSNAVAAKSAADAAQQSASTANIAVATKLNKNAADTLAGRIALQANGAIVAGDLAFDANGNRTSGTGSAMNQKGFVHVAPDGTAAVVINAAGVAVKGDVSGSTGTFGAVVIGTTCSFGQTAYDTGNGGWIQGGATPKWSMRSANGKYLRIDVAAGVFEINGLSLTGSTINNPTITTGFALNLTGDGAAAGPVNSTIGVLFEIAPTGYTGVLSAAWSFTRTSGALPSAQVYITEDSDGLGASFSCTSTTNASGTINITGSCRVRHSGGLSHEVSLPISFTFGGAV